MKKLAVFVELLAVLLCLSQVKAEDSDKSFALYFDFGQSHATNHALRYLAAGSDKTMGVGAGYRFKKASYLTFSLGLEIKSLPLRGNEFLFAADPGGMQKVHHADWSWTAEVLSLKVNIGRGVLSPFLEVGGGIYHLSIEYPFPRFFEQDNKWYFQWEIKDVAETYPGFLIGTGLQLKLGELFILAGIEYNSILIRPALKLPLSPLVSSANIINYKIGIGIAVL